MTYLGAASKAADAKRFADSAAALTEDVAAQETARAIAFLAEAVEELASTLHRER